MDLDWSVVTSRFCTADLYDMCVVVARTSTIVVVMFIGRSQMHVLAGGMYSVVIEGTGCDVNSNSSAAIWSLNDSVIGGPPFISRYDLNFARLDLIVASASFSFFRCDINSKIFLIVWEWSLFLILKNTFQGLLYQSLVQLLEPFFLTVVGNEFGIFWTKFT